MRFRSRARLDVADPGWFWRSEHIYGVTPERLLAAPNELVGDRQRGMARLFRDSDRHEVSGLVLLVRGQEGIGAAEEGVLARVSSWRRRLFPGDMKYYVGQLEERTTMLVVCANEREEAKSALVPMAGTFEGGQ